MIIKEIDLENKILITDNGTEYSIPESWYGLTEDEMKEIVKESSETIENFIERCGYGEVIES